MTDAVTHTHPTWAFQECQNDLLFTMFWKCLGQLEVFPCIIVIVWNHLIILIAVIMSIANFATVVIIAIHDHCCASKGCCACLKWVGTMSIGYKKQSNGIATGMDTKNKHRDVVLLFYMGIRNWISPDWTFGCDGKMPAIICHNVQHGPTYVVSPENRTHPLSPSVVIWFPLFSLLNNFP